MTKAPAAITYTSVVTRETICIALIILAALNDLEIEARDVLNAYITTLVAKKIRNVLSPEFCHNAGPCPIGLKSAGTEFRALLVSFMSQLGYTSCKADPGLWFKAEIRPDDTLNSTLTSFATLATTYCASP